VIVRESRSHLDLAEESLRTNFRRYFGSQDFHRNSTLMPQIASKVYDGHSTFAELSLDGVAAA
jgi:hypothetical protein